MILNYNYICLIIYLYYRYIVTLEIAKNAVEGQYLVWKRQFACLSISLRCQFQNSMTVIAATAVLHNVALSMRDFNENENSSYVINYIGGLAKRNSVVFSVFS